jgi:hypothetical protein
MFLLLQVRGRLGCAGAGEQLNGLLRAAQAAESGRAEEDYGVLDLLAAEAGERLGVFGKDAQPTAVRASEECLIFICQGSARGWVFCLISHKVNEPSGVLMPGNSAKITIVQSI